MLIGNKNAIFTGGLLQALGAFILCIPSTSGLYTGLVVLILGGGLYTPNIISNFGKLYLNKTKLIDSGFTIFYFAVNIGALLGPILISFIGLDYGWNIGFMAAGVTMLLSLIPLLFVKKVRISRTIEKIIPLNKRVIIIAIAFTTVGLFWSVFELIYTRVSNVGLKLSEIASVNIQVSSWSSLITGLFLVISLMMIVIWTYFQSSQLLKLTFGFAFGALSFGTLFLIPGNPEEHHLFIYLTSLLLLSLAEVHIAPIILSILTLYTNPKYLAIILSLSFMTTRFLTLILSLFFATLHILPALIPLTVIISLSFVVVCLIIYYQINKKSSILSNNIID